MEDRFFDDLRKKTDNLGKETDKSKMKDLTGGIAVKLEKFCHRGNVRIHNVFADARKGCKREINKTY